MEIKNIAVYRFLFSIRPSTHRIRIMSGLLFLHHNLSNDCKDSMRHFIKLVHAFFLTDNDRPSPLVNFENCFKNRNGSREKRSSSPVINIRERTENVQH